MLLLGSLGSCCLYFCSAVVVVVVAVAVVAAVIAVVADSVDVAGSVVTIKGASCASLTAVLTGCES